MCENKEMKLLGEEEVDVPAIVVDYNKKVVFDLTATVEEGAIPKGNDVIIRSIKLQFYGDKYSLTKIEKIRRWLKLRIPQKFSKKM